MVCSNFSMFLFSKYVTSILPRHHFKDLIYFIFFTFFDQNKINVTLFVILTYVFDVFDYCWSHDHYENAGHEYWMDLYYWIHWRFWRDIGGEPGDAGGDEIGDCHHCLKKREKKRLKTFLVIEKILNIEVFYNFF